MEKGDYLACALQKHNSSSLQSLCLSQSYVFPRNTQAAFMLQTKALLESLSAVFRLSS